MSAFTPARLRELAKHTLREEEEDALRFATEQGEELENQYHIVKLAGDRKPMILRWTDQHYVVYAPNRLGVLRTARAAGVALNAAKFYMEPIEQVKVFLQEGRSAPGA